MRSKLRGKRDANQSLLVERFKQNFVSVVDTADLGDGFPDLAVSYGGFTVLVEVKVDKGNLTPDQLRFIRDWRAPVKIVRTVEQVDEVCAWLRMQASRLTK